VSPNSERPHVDQATKENLTGAPKGSNLAGNAICINNIMQLCDAAGWSPNGALNMDLTLYGFHSMLNTVTIVVRGEFEWDADKAASNLAKHSVSFEEAATVFADPNVLFLDDGGSAERLVALGLSARVRVLYVVHVERGDRDRIISARRATPTEETFYTQG